MQIIYDTLYIDRYIFLLPDSTFAAFFRGSCALQIALIIIIIILIINLALGCHYFLLAVEHHRP